MDNDTRETLRRVTQNDPSFTSLSLIDNNTYHGIHYGKFISDNSDDYSTLGSAIAINTHLESLVVTSSDGLPLAVADRGFIDDLKSNSSISNLKLYCRSQNIAGGVAQEILKVYQENNSQLTVLGITNANLQSGGDRVLDTLKGCSNLQQILLGNCSITGEQLLAIVDAIRGHCMLEELDLAVNNIGNTGCDAIAALLEDPNCNLHTLYLNNNTIDNEGATTIANSLTNNNKLQKLYLYNNLIDQSVDDVFSNILCNKSSMNDTYLSNHTLNNLAFGHGYGPQLESLLSMNMDTNKSHVAIRKILHLYLDIDVEPLFQWDAEGEQTLKALPHVVNWFERAKVVAAADNEGYNINKRKLSVIFQFAKAMPWLFVQELGVITRKGCEHCGCSCILM